MTAVDVMAVPAGSERDRAIDAWWASIWETFSESRQGVIDLLKQNGIGESG